MELSQQEQEMVQAMRLSEQSQQSTQVDPYKSIRGNLRSSLDYALVSARNSSNSKVRAEADKVYKELQAKGYNSIAESGDSLTDGQIQQLITMSYEASNLDNSIDYSIVRDSAILYDSGATDENLEISTKQAMDELRNSDTSSEWKQVINPETSKAYLLNRNTGQMKEYDAEAEYQEALTESEINFAEYIANGNNPEHFANSFNGMNDLETK